MNDNLLQKDPVRNDDTFESEEELLRWFALAVVFIGMGAVAVLGWMYSNSPMLQQHFQAIIGLPMAGLTALFLVLVLQQIEGKIEFRVLGLVFKGASGPTILWIMCFLAMVLGIRTLWVSK